MKPAWVVVAVIGILAAVASSPSPIRFEDSPPRSEPGTGPGPGLGPGPSRDVHGDAYARGAAAAATSGGAFPPADSEGRVLFLHKKKKKKKKVICGLAGLIAGRDAGDTGVAGSADGRAAEHRAARAVQHEGLVGVQQQQQGGDGRSYGSGVGVAGFLLGTLVGSKLGYGVGAYHQPQPLPAHPIAPVGPVGPVTQTQTQTQVAVPVVPVVPVPAPVHEDYDEVEDDPQFEGGGGGGSLCSQLQNRPDPGPLDSHFPLIHGLLLGGGGGGGQRPVYPRPPPYRPPPPPQFYKPQHSLLYSYVKPWADLFFK